MGKSKKQVSSSSSDESSSSEVVQKQVTKKEKVVKKVESDDSSSSEEVAKKVTKKPVKETGKAKKPAKKVESSDDSDSSSEEQVKPTKKAAAPSKKSKKESSSSSSSDDESSEEEKPKVNEKKRKADSDAEEPAAKRPRSDGDASNTRVFVGNLPFTIDDDQIRAVFKDVGGEIVDIHWVTDRQTGKFYGNGFLEFDSADAAAAAVAMGGTDVGGRPVRCDFAQPKGDRKAAPGGQTPRGEKKAFNARPPTPKPEGCTTVFLGNLSFQIDEDTVRKTFSDCGEISAIRWVERDGQFKGCGFVEFADSSATDAAVAKNGQDVLGRAMRVDYSAPRPPRQ